VAAVERGLKRGLWVRERTVVLMLDETIITETPPLSSCYCRIGQQACVPVTGNRQKRILHGALNVTSGAVMLLITEEWNQDTHQAFLLMLRDYWRGWDIILFEDRGTPHTAEESRELATDLGIEVRLLPRATPELNAMDHLWRHMKRRALANQRTRSIDESADAACQYILGLSRQERLRQAGVLSGNFWLTK
jgi:transposase